MPTSDEVEEETVDAPLISQWEFIDRIPTREEVVELMQTLPDCYGVEYKDFAQYVQGLPSSKKVKVTVRTKTGGTRKEDKFFDVVTLYMSVAGRLKMVNAIGEKNGLMIDFQPEPVTPTGVPGFLQMDDRLVYREYCVIRALPDHAGGLWSAGDMLGSKPGMAWVPSSGGRQAAGSNPYEKVETAARGRAIAAWGIGVLPGSGVASMEEMLGNPRTLQQPEPEKERPSREQLIEAVREETEKVRQMRQIESEEMDLKMLDYLHKTFGLPVDGPIDWTSLKDGQLQLTLSQLQQTTKSLRL